MSYDQQDALHHPPEKANSHVAGNTICTVFVSTLEKHISVTYATILCKLLWGVALQKCMGIFTDMA